MALRPNLFEFATSELSQDAFICWLVSWLNTTGNTELKTCAREFVAEMYNRYRPNTPIEASDVGLPLDGVERQRDRSDIQFGASIKGRHVYFLIEDKTDTTYHSNQLECYKEKFDEDHDGCDTVYIYLKTGFVFPSERLYAEDSGYRVIDSEGLVSILAGCEEENPILRDFIEVLYSRIENRLRLEKKIDEGNLDGLGEHGGQIYFAQNLVESLLGHGFAFPHNCITHGNNIGGAPWTQIELLRSPLTAGNEVPSETIFIRIDNNRKNPDGGNYDYYLGFRQWLYLQDFDENRRTEAAAEKVKRLGMLKSIFEGSKLDELSPGKIRGDQSGANESEIAVFFLGQGKNTLKAVLRAIPKLTNTFINQIKRSDIYQLSA